MSDYHDDPYSYRAVKENDKNKLDRPGNTQFAVVSKNVFQPVTSTVDTLPPGYYEIQINQQGIFFRKQELNTDALVNFEDAVGAKVIEEVHKFWQGRNKFKTEGFLHRRGYLLYGPPGSGKTSLIQLIIQEAIKLEGVIFTCKNPATLEEGLKAYREVDPDRNVVCLFEDIDSIINHWGDDELLALLDGENQINHVLNVATTNYLSKLDKRIRQRPRRFDRLFNIDMPPDSVREAYLKLKCPSLTEDEMKLWVKSSKGFSFGALAELVVSVKCIEIPFEEAIKTLKGLMEIERKGFGNTEVV